MTSPEPVKLLPLLYPILDAGLLRAANIPLEDFARELRSAGVRFLQYRDKDASDDEVLARARSLRRIFPAGETTLILNDRVELCALAGFDGVHLGQEDMGQEDMGQEDMALERVRELLGRELLGKHRLLGLSTHTPEQVRQAARTSADYLAIGPVYPTRSKERPDPVVGLAGVAQARALTAKPLVAIGGITRENGRAVLDAGADSVAMISALLPSDRSTGDVIRDILVNFR
jgi:thiamine-phosphate pyrophosphorylase